MSSRTARIRKRWEKAIQGYYGSVCDRVRDDMLRAERSSPNTEIWLGGPGRGNRLYLLRRCIQKSLNKRNFKAMLSEDYGGGPDLASKEINEVDALDLVIILAASPGASAEAIEFANLNYISPKLFVFIPREYRHGYVYRSLNSSKHRIVTENSLFSLKKARRYDPEIVLKVFAEATDKRLGAVRRRRIRRTLNT